MNYFTISVLEGIRLLLTSFENNYNENLDHAKKLAEISNPSKSKYDFDSAYKLISTYGEEYFTIKEDNEINILRSNLYKLIIALNPNWVYKVNLGRDFVFNAISTMESQIESSEILHTFKVCKLKNSIDINTVLWWKNLSEFYRNNQTNIEKGIDGEFLTLRYENNKLNQLHINKQPLLKSLDDETLGYDVLSFRKSENTIYEIYIETKFSSNNQFFLTKNEWSAAKKYKDNYFIYYWDGISSNPRIIKFEGLTNYILDDKENSTWDKLVINL